ncbi:MAG: hypothetical protein AVDCRST_MAG68-30 [uncultured Gemmatimonadetes bacterium]|uniref:Uncharacterized protein n=1 Tax=uncultured Gemmatimonadota bacterium TaxID=203437 RepID=A0A6J4K679_9BACT|nr:MAG: hypothetical protein AVDCRST_MAG68-30 [uncultured Gemmatimonadota bacterium]
MVRHRLLHVATHLLVAIALSGCAHRSKAMPRGAPAAAPAPRPGEVTLRIDYAGAEAMIAALERDSLPDAAVDSLLEIHGVSMMVDNVVRLVPGVGRADFRTAIQRFVRTGEVAGEHVAFNLQKARSQREGTRALLTYIRENEQAVLERTLAAMAPYTPETGPLHLKAYLMNGGTSTGFVRTTAEGDVFYFNLADAAGDREGAMSFIAHEVFHLVQKAALRRVPALAAVADVESLPLPERTLAAVVHEGTADLVSDPERFGGNGAIIAMQRKRFGRDAEPTRVRENFALFDTTFQQAVRGGIGWREVLDRGFMSDPRFYALGREMAKEIERRCGAACIRRLLQQRPVEFFLQYVSLYREHPDIVGRFSRETERHLSSLR